MTNHKQSGNPEQQSDPIAYRTEQARKAHERGWVLTPLRGKRPYLKGWASLPPPDLATVERWAREGNVGVRTGAISGLSVLDNDNENDGGLDGLDLPQTVTSITGGGRVHRYFIHPEGGLRNSASKLALKVDVRGDGGVIVLPGSIHPQTGQPYRWAPGLSPDQVALAPFPESVLERLRPKRKPPKVGEQARRQIDQRLAVYARSALRRSVQELRYAAEGSRNDSLNRVAFGLGRFVGAGLLDRTEVEDALYGAAVTTGLDPHEIEATIRSGLDAGVGDPHDVEDLKKRITGTDWTPGQERKASSSRLDKPLIIIEPGDLPRTVDAAERALLHAKEGIYQRQSTLVRIARTTTPLARAGYQRAEGALIIEPLDVPFLVERLTEHARWQKCNRHGGLVPTDCPEKIARTYLSRKGKWRVDSLRGIVEAPTLRPDGTIIQLAGYDRASGIYFDPGNTAFPKVPERPTPEEARAALDALLHPVRLVPWVSEADRAVFAAASITSLVRQALRTAPLFAFRATKRGSGKSMLADIVALLATGRVAPVMSQGMTEEEDRKRIFAVLLEGAPVTCIDNVERPLGGAALCSALTQEVVKDRILGVSGTAAVPTTTLWLATGNNLRFQGDTISRVLPSDLNAKHERPEERRFDFDPREYVNEHRADLVVAGLTLLRGYFAAGKPDQELVPFGRYEDWSAIVRSALVWAGSRDPCETRRRLEDSDPVGSLIRAILAEWHSKFGEKPITAADVIARAGGGVFGDALKEVAAGDDGVPSAQRLGSWLATYADRIEGGLCVQRAGKRDHTALWRVVRCDPA